MPMFKIVARRGGAVLMMLPEAAQPDPQDDGSVPRVVHRFEAVTREHATMRLRDFSEGWSARAGFDCESGCPETENVLERTRQAGQP